MCKEEDDREGQKKEEEKEEERKVGSKDEGEGGSTSLLDPSGCVTSKEEECRVEGERVKNKQKNNKKLQKGENAVYGSEECGYQGLGSCYELWNLIQRFTT